MIDDGYNNQGDGDNSQCDPLLSRLDDRLKPLNLAIIRGLRNIQCRLECRGLSIQKGLLAIAKLKPLSLFISLLLMLKKALDNVKIEKWKVKVVSALQ